MKKVDIFGDGYYKNNRIFMTLIGLWPESSILEKILVRCAVVVLPMTTITAQYAFLIKTYPNFNDMVFGIISQLIVVIGFTKYSFVMMNMKEIGIFIDKLREDWDALENSASNKTLHFYATRGQIGTKFYMYTIYSAALFFSVAPLKQGILDKILPLNESRPKIFMLDADYTIYGIDANEQFYPTLIHSSFTVMIVMDMLVAADTLVLILVEHCCGLFESVGIQLREMDLGSSSESQHKIICRSVIIHHRAISLAEFIESSFTMMYGVAVLLCTLTISITEFQTIMKIDDLTEVSRLGIFVIGQLVQLLLMSFPGQELLDHSARVSEGVYSCNWSNISTHGRKLISIMLIRSMKPLRITAGRFCVLNMETYANIIRTSFSYMTVMLGAR